MKWQGVYKARGTSGCPPPLEYCPPPSPYPDRLVTHPDGCEQKVVVVKPPTCEELNNCPEYPKYNECKLSPVKIQSVDVNSTPKQLSRLGTLPQFGDSHTLTPEQFYQKLNARYNASAKDKKYLDYLLTTMGYNGWADAQPYMFSDDVLPENTTGLMGFGGDHHYSYSILPSAPKDRQAFRIQSANGQVVHFMKSCGNYFYACEQVSE